jgi:hypothetical protein
MTAGQWFDALMDQVVEGDDWSDPRPLTAQFHDR